MRFQFALVPVASLVCAAPVGAEQLQDLAHAQAVMFPGAQFTPSDLTLSDAQLDALEKTSGAIAFHREVKLWRVSTGGWFFLDQVPGRDDRITYAVGLDSSGALKDIEILVCREGYCGLSTPEWRAQFTGKRAADAAALSDQVHLISGSTLSTAHLTDGIKRVLTTYALFVRPR